jgi:hypothetical protein
MAETYSFPSAAFISVISVIHFVRGVAALKWRFNKSSDLRASRSALVIPFDFLHLDRHLDFFRVVIRKPKFHDLPPSFEKIFFSQ